MYLFFMIPIDDQNSSLWKAFLKKLRNLLYSLSNSYNTTSCTVRTQIRTFNRHITVMTEKSLTGMCMICKCNITIGALFKMPTIFTYPCTSISTTIIEYQGFLSLLNSLSKDFKQSGGNQWGCYRNIGEWNNFYHNIHYPSSS